jgi:hypothetical protein
VKQVLYDLVWHLILASHGESNAMTGSKSDNVQVMLITASFESLCNVTQLEVTINVAVKNDKNLDNLN